MNTQDILIELAKVLARNKGIEFSRSIEVSEEAGGDIKITTTHIYFDPLFAVIGNPIELMEHVFFLCEKFDRQREEATLNAIAGLKADIFFALKELSSLIPKEEIYPVIERALSHEKKMQGDSQGPDSGGIQ